MIWRTKMQARVRHKVQPKDSTCFKESKLVRIQFASNKSKLVWIQFASNESKLVPRNLDPESPSTLGISLFSVMGGSFFFQIKKLWVRVKYMDP